jgi:putative oxidoreductase
MNWSGTQKGEGFEYHLLAISAAALVMLKGGGALSVDAFLSGEGGAAESSAPMARAAHR